MPSSRLRRRTVVRLAGLPRKRPALSGLLTKSASAAQIFALGAVESCVFRSFVRTLSLALPASLKSVLGALTPRSPRGNLTHADRCRKVESHANTDPGGHGPAHRPPVGNRPGTGCPVAAA